MGSAYREFSANVISCEKSDRIIFMENNKDFDKWNKVKIQTEGQTSEIKIREGG